MKRPHRRLEVKLNLNADDYEAILSTLRQILFDLDGLEGRGYSSVSGGPDASYILDIQFDPEVTHESYFEALNLYLKHEPPPDMDRLSTGPGNPGAVGLPDDS